MSSNGVVGSSANNSYAADDMDAFFDFNQADSLYAPSDTLSPSSKVSPAGTVNPQNTFMSHEHADEHQTFTGPSHEYDRFHQQTGLPSGSVSAVSTMNEFNPFPMGNGYGSGIDLDMDFNGSPSTMPAFFYPNDSSGMEDLVGSSNMSEQPSQPMQRLRPGMHSQQAQQAKADALARQQRQQQLGQQIMQQRHQSNASSQGSTRSGRARSQGSADPAVDERISQLLDQMRQNSNTIPEEDDSQESNSLPSVLRNRRDDEDMDDDERLLASEEGKKLSSKERRQLRNKVSARAFRSRRKEYITQLEGEVAGKAQECNELRMRNRQLMDQNNQLTQLTQTLLRHPAFATFMEDMSNDPSILASIQQQQQQPPVQHSLPSSTNKDVNPNRPMKQEQQQQDIHVGMTMVPDQHFDFSNLTLGSNAWAGNSQFNFQQPQVFAVFETPALPNVEEITSQALSGKPTETAEVSEAEEPPKVDYPVVNKVVPSHPISEPVALSSTDKDSEPFDDPEFPLFATTSSTKPVTSSPCSIQDAARMLEQSLSGKTSVSFTLEVEGSTSDDAKFAEIDRLFASERDVVRRVRAITSEYLS